MLWQIKLVVNAVGKVTVAWFIVAPAILSSRSLAVQVAEAEPDKTGSEYSMRYMRPLTAVKVVVSCTASAVKVPPVTVVDGATIMPRPKRFCWAAVKTSPATKVVLGVTAMI